MRLTDEQIYMLFNDELLAHMQSIEYRGGLGNTVVTTVRRCLALAALPDEQKPYEDVERRGFSVSQPGELPR